MFIGSLKKLIFSFLRSKFGLYYGNSALSARFFCVTLPKNVCNFLIIRGTIRKKTPLSHARPAATVVAPPLPRPPWIGCKYASGPPASGLGSITGSTEGCQGAVCHHWEPWELSVIPSQHRRMSGTRQKEPGSTEGCQGAVCHPGSPGSSLSSITAQKDVRNQTEGTREHRRMSGSCLSSWEPWELSVIPSQHRRMSGTRQKEPGSTEGTRAQKDVRGSQRAPYIIIYTLYGLRNITVL